MNIDLCKRVIADAVASGDGATIEEMVEAAFQAGVFGEEWEKHAARTLAKSEIRKIARRMTAPDGNPLLWNVSTTNDRDDEDDQDARYKPLPLFHDEDFHVAVRPFVRMAQRGVDMALVLQEAAAKRGVQLTFPGWFPVRASV